MQESKLLNKSKSNSKLQLTVLLLVHGDNIIKIRAGMEKVSDHGTIGPRKKFNSQKILPKEEKIVINY